MTVTTKNNLEKCMTALAKAYDRSRELESTHFRTVSERKVRLTLPAPAEAARSFTLGSRRHSLASCAPVPLKCAACATTMSLTLMRVVEDGEYSFHFCERCCVRGEGEK